MLGLTGLAAAYLPQPPPNSLINPGISPPPFTARPSSLQYCATSRQGFPGICVDKKQNEGAEFWDAPCGVCLAFFTRFWLCNNSVVYLRPRLIGLRQRVPLWLFKVRASAVLKQDVLSPWTATLPKFQGRIFTATHFKSVLFFSDETEKVKTGTYCISGFIKRSDESRSATPWLNACVGTFFVGCTMWH